MPVPYTFASATAAIPLSNLDSNFATAVTIGNTAVQLGNTITTLNNVTINASTLSSCNIAGGGANGVVYINSSNVAVANATVHSIDSNGNMGLGVTPSAWQSTTKSIDISSGGAIYAGSVNIGLIANGYYNSAGTATYKGSTYANAYIPNFTNNGSHVWYNAPSGTAGNAITFTQAMTLSNAGNLQVPAMYSTTVTTPRNVFIDSSGNFGGISSTRASKSNIVNQDSASWIYQLTPVTFNYRKKDTDGNYTEEVESEVQYGLIAEDVEGIKPEFCIYVNGKLAGVHYDRMVSPIIKALQELNAKFDSYKATHP